MRIKNNLKEPVIDNEYLEKIINKSINETLVNYQSEKMMTLKENKKMKKELKNNLYRDMQNKLFKKHIRDYADFYIETIVEYATKDAQKHLLRKYNLRGW